MHPRRRASWRERTERGEGSTREGVNGRAAGHPGSENPEKYVIVSSTVITKNRTNERRNERLNVARVGVHAFPPPPSSRSHHPFLPLEWIPASPFLFCLPPPVPPPSPPPPPFLALFFSLLRTASTSASPPPMQSLCAAHPGVLSPETMIS